MKFTVELGVPSLSWLVDHVNRHGRVQPINDDGIQTVDAGIARGVGIGAAGHQHHASRRQAVRGGEGRVVVRGIVLSEAADRAVYGRDIAYVKPNRSLTEDEVHGRARVAVVQRRVDDVNRTRWD